MYRLTYTAFLFIIIIPFLSASAQEKKTAAEEPAENTEKQTKQQEQQKNPYFLNIVQPERSVQRRYEQAVRLIEAGRDSEAAQLLGAILESSADCFVQPLNNGNENIPQTTDRTFFDNVLEKLQGLSAKGKEAYSLQFETQAKRLLENAVKNDSFAEIQRVARSYFPTSSGGTATFLVGMEQFRRCDWDAAAGTFLRLETVKPRSADELKQYEPLLCLSHITCLLQTGKKYEAKYVAEKFLKNFSEPEIALSGEELWKPKTADEIIDKINTSIRKSPKISTADWLERTGWLLPKGTASQNAETAADVPLLDFIWAVPPLNLPSLNVSAEQILRIVAGAEETYIPASQPLLVQDTLIIRSIGEITAVDVKTGKRLWVAEEPEPKIPSGISISNNIRMNVFSRGMNIQLPHRFMLRLFFWHDRVANQMSSEGTKVFSIEGLEPMPNLNFGGNIRAQKIHVCNNLFVEDPRGKQGNTLTARDIKTGKIVWQAGKFPYVQKEFDNIGRQIEEMRRNETAERERQRQEREKAKKQQNGEQSKQAEQAKRTDKIEKEDAAAEDVFMSEVRFLGAPLPLQGKLYCIAERDSVIRLLVLDMQTGKFLSQLPLVQVSVPIENETFRRYYGLMPTANGGIIYCPTGAGTLAAVDAVSLSPLWCFSYAKPALEEEKRGSSRFQNQFQTARNGENPEFKQLFEKDGWQVPCLISEGGKLLFAPPDNTGLYCLGNSTGKLLWTNEEFNRSNSLFPACIRNGICYIAAADSFISVSMETGKKLDGIPAVKLPDKLRPAGTGIHNGAMYFLPLSNASLGIIDLEYRNVRLVSYRQSSGEKPPSVMETAQELQLGNLIGLRGRFFSYSPNAVYGFDQWKVLKASAEKRSKNNPDDIEGLILSGRIKRAEGNIEQAAVDFRRAYQLSKTAGRISLPAADELRNTLLQAIRTDYAKWKSSAAELESLTEFPEELGEVLFYRAAGAAKDGDSAAFIDVLKKVIMLESGNTIQIKTEPELTSELHCVLGLMLTQKPAANAEHFAKDLHQFSETFFIQLKERKNPKEYLPLPNLLNYEQQTIRSILIRPRQEQDILISSGEIYRWKLFADIFRSMPAAAKADAVLQELYRQHQLFTALELSENKPVFRILPEASPDKKVVVPYNENKTEDDTVKIDKAQKSENVKNMLPPPSLRYKPDNAQDEKYTAETLRWNTENPVFRNTAEFTQTADNQNRQRGAAQRILSHLTSRNRNAGNQAEIPYIGCYDKFISPYSYLMEISFANTASLICANEFGEEQWRLDLSSIMPDIIEYGFFSGNNTHYIQGFNTLQVYLKGCGHLLILVQNNSILAIDTFKADLENSPKVLWTKKSSVPQQERKMFTSRPLNNLSGNNWFAVSSLFVSGKVVCYCETDKVFGLDPLTGRTLWCRELTTPYPACALLGDRETLFIVYPQSNTAVALSPETGRIIASGKIPQNGVFTYGTNVVFLKNEWKQNGRRFQINTADLRDLLNVKNDIDNNKDNANDDNADNGSRNLQIASIWSDISEHSQICPVLDGQVLALLSWDNKVLYLFDMLNQRDLLGRLDDNRRRTGVKMPVSQLKKVESWDCDLDVQLVNGKYLAIFTDKRQVDTSQKSLTEDGIVFRRQINVVPNISCKSTGSAVMMLFEPDGKECWQKPVKINDWFMLQNVPAASPLVLFAMSITDQQNNKAPDFSTGLMGIDKATGKMSFRKLIPSQQGNDNSVLRGFRVYLSPDKKEIYFGTANRIVSAAFEQKP